MNDDDEMGVLGAGEADAVPEGDQPPATETGGSGKGHRINDRDTAAADDDDRIGYGRPPQHSRFKVGQSGNPRGRPKSSKGLKTLLRRELNDHVRVTENGKTKTLSKLEVVVKRMVEQAAKGDAKARVQLFELRMALFGVDDEEGKVIPFTPEEEAILRGLQARRFASDVDAGHEPQEPSQDDPETDEASVVAGNDGASGGESE